MLDTYSKNLSGVLAYRVTRIYFCMVIFFICRYICKLRYIRTSGHVNYFIVPDIDFRV